MSIKTTVPIQVTPEAAARVAELGMQRELEQMLEHTLQVVPGLRFIDVIAMPQYDTGEDPRVIIEPVMDDPHLPCNPTDTLWYQWMWETFPPEVCLNFCMLSAYGESDAG